MFLICPNHQLQGQADHVTIRSAGPDGGKRYESMGSGCGCGPAEWAPTEGFCVEARRRDPSAYLRRDLQFGEWP